MRMNGSDCEDSVFANISMAMLETCSGRGQKGFEELRFSQLAKKSQCVSADIFVWMLQVISYPITGGLSQCL